MKSAREMIFKRLRAEQNRRASPLSPAALDGRIKSAPAHTRPAQSEDLTALFIQRFCARGGTVERIASVEQIVTSVCAYLCNNQLPNHLLVADAVPALAWPGDIVVENRAAVRNDLLALSACALAVAETGSLMFCSGAASPTTHNFVPDHHIVIVRTMQLVAHLEDAWSHLRQQSGGMPRAVNMVAGPSRTGDIEQTIQLGAHGPRCLHVLLVG